MNLKVIILPFLFICGSLYSMRIVKCSGSVEKKSPQKTDLPATDRMIRGFATKNHYQLKYDYATPENKTAYQLLLDGAEKELTEAISERDRAFAMTNKNYETRKGITHGGGVKAKM